MDPITLIILLIVGFFFLRSSSFGASFGLGPTGGIVNQPPPTGFTLPPNPAYSSQYIGQEAQQAHSAITGAASALSGLAEEGSKAASVIPVVGAAIAAISDALLAAHAKRAAAATDENSAVAHGVPGFDQAVSMIVNAYNQGQITAGQVSQLLGQVMQQWWQEVGPHIQSGRNGCQNGASCPASANMQSATSTATTAPSTYCSGSIGAACCVGCASLQLSVDNMEYAVSQVDSHGGSMAATIQAVFPSKYGGINRPLYHVTFTRPSGGLFHI